MFFAKRNRLLDRFGQKGQVAGCDQIRVVLVGPKQPVKQRQSVFFSRPRDRNLRGCIEEWVGAVCNDIGTGGPWTPSEDTLHINCKELLAAFHAVRSFVRSTNVSVELRLDNQSAVIYINQGGGTQSSTLPSIAVECLLLCESREISIRAIHLPGALNRAADSESRRSQGCAEWRLCPTTFQQVAHLWHVDVDLFLAEWNHQLPRFVSWGPQPSAWAVDALSISWSKVNLYLFPPFKLIGRCAAKVRRDHSIATLITPYWPGQYWFPVLLEMSIDSPRVLRPHPRLLTSSNGLSHPMFQSGSHLLVAWRISGSVTQAREFRQTLSNSCSKISDLTRSRVKLSAFSFLSLGPSGF